MPPTTDLPARILAAIDETERAARFVLTGYAGHEASWTVLSTGVIQLGDDLLPTGDGPLAEHIARHDPEATLRRCAADRRILELHRQVPADVAGNERSEPTGCQICGKALLCDWIEGNGLCDTILALAEGHGITKDGGE